MPKILSFYSHPRTSGFGTTHIASLDCGHEEYAGYYKQFSEQVGDSIACERCEAIAKSVVWIDSLDRSEVHHIRFRARFGGTYTFYKFDPASPSNFFSIGGCYATPETDSAITRKGLCAPISPTECA